MVNDGKLIEITKRVTQKIREVTKENFEEKFEEIERTFGEVRWKEVRQNMYITPTKFRKIFDEIKKGDYGSAKFKIIYALRDIRNYQIKAALKELFSEILEKFKKNEELGKNILDSLYAIFIFYNPKKR